MKELEKTAMTIFVSRLLLKSLDSLTARNTMEAMHLSLPTALEKPTPTRRLGKARESERETSVSLTSNSTGLAQGLWV